MVMLRRLVLVAGTAIVLYAWIATPPQNPLMWGLAILVTAGMLVCYLLEFLS